MGHATAVWSRIRTCFFFQIPDPKYSRVPPNGVTAVAFYAGGAVERSSENVAPGLARVAMGTRRASECSDPDITSAPLDDILTREAAKTPDGDRAFIIGARYNKWVHDGNAVCLTVCVLVTLVRAHLLF